MLTKLVRFPNIEITYYIGRSAKENFDIIDAAEPYHIWFHVEGQSSCHVVAEIPQGLSREDIRRVVKQGAVICKQYSRFASQKKLDIVYTSIQNVIKGEIMGSVMLMNSKTIAI